MRRIGLIFAACVAAVVAGKAQAAPDNPDCVAAIVGNKAYGKGIPAVEYAHNDAESFKRYVVDVLGCREGNIIDLRDATKGRLEAAFGNRDSHRGKVFQYVRPGRSDVVVFYSGHGVPSLRDKRGYLLPTDAEPDTVEVSGFPVEVLYDNLAKVEARSVTVYLDACFSGDSPWGTLVKGASGISVVPKLPAVKAGDKAAAVLAVLTAARGDELASWDQEAKHGLFTRILLDGLYGAADGNGDGQVSMAEAKAYLDEEMTYQARRRFNREQHATLHGDATRVVARVVPGAKAPRVEPPAPAPAPAPAATVAVVPRPPEPRGGQSVPDAPGTVFRDCADCPEMVVVPAGSFVMGSDDGDADEKPVHRVTIGRAFAVGKYEVTQGEWQAVMGGNSNPSKFPGLRNPVEQVSWDDAQEFIRRLNAKVRSVVSVSTGGDGPYRLLTEAEWEYAARAGTTTKWSCGDSEGCLSSVAVYGANSGGRTAAVGSKSGNGFGLHDLHGNVWEWVQDCFADSYVNASSDGSPVIGINTCNRVSRGGSWINSPRGLRFADRDWNPPVNRVNFLGFRLARTLR
ncbi:MAG: SUMF1/EgtB/PvdO family nonheme iron enzyme [Magnetospirillum sp.]|nr:SUMF1/EgtB/PvdO family nonheme iron enzyme [Magnetospirillum sp.]